FVDPIKLKPFTMQSIKKYYKLQASAADVYNAITNPLMIEIWTGEPVVFQAVEDTEFSLWDGSITGRNVELEPDKLIQQIWYFDEIESIVTIKLHPEKDYTNVELRHENIPDEAHVNIADGWDEDYFDALMELFN
ncbi:MAG: SRPBCC domain-containing protein, partial [Prolixibacteraceae bacterium]|nr:SRPBCC domain-containing protein [Prolixibacteraceae bacterium]